MEYFSEEDNEQPAKNYDTDLFVNLEVQTMSYFSEQVRAIHLRDVSKIVLNHDLKWRNDETRRQIKNLKSTNENVAHEMRTPLASIIILIGVLLTLSSSSRDY